VRQLVRAIQEDDEAVVAQIVRLSQSRRLFAPLAFTVGAFAMLFDGLKLLLANWRLMLVQVLPAVWIWLAMYDLKARVLHGRSLSVLRGPVLIPIGLAIVTITVACFFLNAVFAFAITQSRPPKIRPAYVAAQLHRVPIVLWGASVGVLLALATTVAPRWGNPWFALCLGVVIGVMMVCYVAVPSRLIGIKPVRSRRDKLTASALGAALGATVCTPPYLLGRLGILMLGSKYLLIPGIVALTLGFTLQAGATGAVRAIKMSLTLTAGILVIGLALVGSGCGKSATVSAIGGGQGKTRVLATTAATVSIPAVASPAHAVTASPSTLAATAQAGASPSNVGSSSPPAGSSATKSPATPSSVAPLPARPVIIQSPIPFGPKRKAEMVRYAVRHYGLITYRLIDPHVIVIHYTETPDFQATYDTFAPDVPDNELHELPNTCAHFVVDADGVIHQLVPLGIMCRHTVGLNWTAIGIEHVGYSDAEVLDRPRQMRASLRLVRWLRCRFHIPVAEVIGHNESLSSLYHHENVRLLRNQTHSDFDHIDMQVYRARLRAAGSC
jgi:N-acetylmuramoyl-L-alanine amidase